MNPANNQRPYPTPPPEFAPPSVAERPALRLARASARLRKALAESFPALRHVTGRRAFDALTDRYHAHLQRRSIEPESYGAMLVGFLHGDRLTSGLPFLPDLTELEWQVQRAFEAPRLPPLDPCRVPGWDSPQWARTRLRFQPSLALIDSPWPVLTVWKAREQTVESIDIELRGRPERVLVHRAGPTVTCERLDAAQARTLACLLAGCTVGEVVELCEREEYRPGHVSAWFARWMAIGLVVGLSFQPAEHAAPQ